MDIFVAKLSSETKAENLTELFSQFGNVVSSKIIMDRNTGKSKCYGFIEMADDNEGTKAIEQLNNSNFMGNKILVKKSEPRPQEKRPVTQRTDSRNRYGSREHKRDKPNSTIGEKNFNRYN